MTLKSKSGPIDVLVINQNVGSPELASLPSQCQINAHGSNTLTSTYTTTPSILEAVSCLHNHNTTRTVYSGMAVTSQLTNTEVTSTIGGSIVSPIVAQQENVIIPPHTMSDLHNTMSQDDGKFKSC